VFDAPRADSTAFAVTATDATHRRWLASASGRRLVPDNAPSATPASPPASTSLPGNDGATVAANPQAPASTADASLQPQRQMGSLRVDGGLIEEGAVNPTFAPLNLDGQQLDSKPIVVEAVIGKDGGVEDVRLVSAPASQLAQAVVSAVKLWRYRPFYRDGQPIEFVTRITFNFSLPNANTH
jgi:periplasmic protein TonB